MRSGPLKIAIAARTARGWTGMERILFENARGLAGRGCEVHVYAERIDAERLRSCGARPHRLPRWPWGSRLKRRAFDRFFRWSAAGKGFDLVWGHGDLLDQDVLSLHNCVHAAHEAVHGRPLSEDSGPGWMHGRILREKRFRLLIANSRLMQREVVSRFNVPADLVRVVYPGHDPVRFKAQDRAERGSAVRRELGLAEDHILVGLITSGDFQKRGAALFLEALSRMPETEKTRLHAVILGSENRLGPYRRLAGQTGLGARVRFFPPEAAVERFYHALDIYVHPALYEEFGLSVQEALACGVPVLSSRRVGACELLEGTDYEAGFLPESPEPGQLAADIVRLMREPALRGRLAEAGPSAVRANDWAANFRATLDALNVLGQSPL
ncbi:MAG: glycosyltransferase family 4 protein [Elusimicrobiota bacterium]|jgi:UDP-glucose:(heptosyl)LPS alpha-1,3-glucosyltransferase